MSIEFWIIKDDTDEDHALHIQNLRNQGWERVFSGFKDEQYVSYLERDTATPTPQNGVYLASLLEVLEKRVADIVERLEVLEATADDDSNPDDLAAPSAWVQQQRFIPLAHLYEEVIREALAEDEALEGVAGESGPIGDYVEPMTEAEKRNLGQLFAAWNEAVDRARYPLEGE